MSARPELSAAAPAHASQPQPVAGRIRVGFIVGPTGAGKSALAIEVAERLGAEIVNADSRQVYRGMDIGTAKPGVAERRRVPHHLIDVRDPWEPFDVAGFVSLADEAIGAIARRGRPAIVVGGSGLYLRALRRGIFAGPAACAEIRAELAALAAERGPEHLHAILEDQDPAAAARIGPRDLHRITRALEVLRLTGTPISEHQRRHAFSGQRYETLTVGLKVPREQLYATIDRRLEEMVAAGMPDEVRGLIEDRRAAGSAALVSIGYKHIAAHLSGELTLEAALKLARRDTRRLAKRQLTWFRADPEIVWVDAANALEQALDLFKRFFERQEGAADG